jgi:hypothetical protein
MWTGEVRMGGDTPRLEAEAQKLKGELDKLGQALLSTDDKPSTIVKMMAEREEKLTALRARLASMKTAPQVLDLEARRMEKDARQRIRELRGVVGRRGEAAKRALAALLDGKLTFTPTDDKQYEITGRIVTGALVHLPLRPQRDSNPAEKCAELSPPDRGSPDKTSGSAADAVASPATVPAIEEQAKPVPPIDPAAVLYRALDQATAAGNLDLVDRIMARLEKLDESRPARDNVLPFQPTRSKKGG